MFKQAKPLAVAIALSSAVFVSSAFAQVDAKGDGSYEYKFRVRNMDSNTGEIVNVFEGDYTVKIYKVIPNTNNLI